MFPKVAEVVGLLEVLPWVAGRKNLILKCVAFFVFKAMFWSYIFYLSIVISVTFF